MRRAVGTPIAYAVSIALGLAGGLEAPACTWSTACMNGRITTESIPDATVGVEYSYQLTESCGGRDAVSWQLSGDQLPPGISLSFDGRLAGTPTTAGRFTLQVSLSLTSRGAGGAVYPAGFDSRTYSMTVRP